MPVKQSIMILGMGRLHHAWRLTTEKQTEIILDNTIILDRVWSVLKISIDHLALLWLPSYTSGTRSYPEKSCNGGTASSFWWKWIGNIPLQVLEGSAVVCMCTNITFWSKHLEFCRFWLKKVFLHYSIYSKKYTACKLAVFC